ncbi:hypothetical protein BGW38_000765, partial [Lunasporangiospora selenospora]
MRSDCQNLTNESEDLRNATSGVSSNDRSGETGLNTPNIHVNTESSRVSGSNLSDATVAPDT